MWALPIVAGMLTDLYLRKQFSRRWPLGLGVAYLSYFALRYVFPLAPMHTAKGLLLIQLLFVAAYNDARTHEIPDWIHILMLLTGFLEFQPQTAILGFFLVSVPFLLVAMFSHGGIGGGDVKFTAACGFALGAFGIVFGAILAMVFLICAHLIFYHRRSNRQKAYAMAPYLAVGCFFAYLLC